MKRFLCIALVLFASSAWGEGWLKQSTAATLKLGPFVDSTDGVTAETGLTIAQGDIQISKAGAAFAQTSDAAPTTTHDADGWYPVPLTTTDTGTLGRIVVQVQVAGAVPVWWEGMVVPAVVYDSMVAGSDYLTVDTHQVEGGDATDALGTAQTGDAYARLGAPAGASVSADVAAVKAETASIVADTGTDGVVLANDAITAAKIAADAVGASEIADGAIDAGALGADAITSAKIADNALAAEHIAASAIGASELATDAIGADELAATALAEFVTVDTGETAAASGSVAELSGAGAPTAAAVADAVWDELIADHDTAGSAAVLLSSAGGAAGTGDTAVDEDYGGTDTYSYETAGGVGIGDATIIAYLTSDYNAGTYTVRATTVTDDNGDWEYPMYLDSGSSYTLVYRHPSYSISTATVTVE